MPKFLTSLILMLTLLTFSTLLYADAFFNTPPKKEASAPITAPKPILSPDDFRNKVSTLNQDTKNNTGEALNQELAKQPPPPVPEMSTPTTISPQSGITQPNTTPTQISTPPAEAISPPPSTVTASPPNQPVIVPQQPVTPPPSTPVKQAQPYTGFGTGDGANSGKAIAPNNNQTNGWNIKY